MKIPSALAISKSEQPSQQLDEIWITVPEAAALLKIRPNAVMKRILKGTLEGKRSEDMPFTADGQENFVVLLKSLLERLQYQYHVSRLDEHVSVDLVSPHSVFGDRWLEQFVNVAQVLREAIKVRKLYRGTGNVKKELTKLARSHGISLSR